MHSLIRLIEGITSRTGFLVALAIIPLVMTSVYEVFARYAFGAPTSWAFEIGYMITGTHFLIGAAITLARNDHVRIDIAYASFAPKTQAIVMALFYVVLLLPFLAMLNEALWHYALNALASGEKSGQSGWNPPIWPFRCLLALGFSLLALQVIAETLKCVSTLRDTPYSNAEI